VLIPFAGTLVEVLVDEGDEVAKGDVLCVVRQMKMELEVRAPRSGTVGFVMEVEDGGEVSEGMLAATVVEGERARL
jgi:biotin carboxyl carrier protein